MPNLLQTLSDLNHRLLTSDNDKNNLVKSVPVALREITRDTINIRGQLESVTNSMDQRLNELEAVNEKLCSELHQLRSDLNQRQHVFEVEQLPNLLQTLSDLNHRQLTSDNDKNNLVKSVPVALREITRDIINIRGQLESVTNSVDQRLNETRGQLESVTNSVDQRLNETRGQLESVTNSVDQRLNETRGQLESVTNSVDQRLNETRGQLESVTNSVDQRLNETRGQLESVTNSVDQRLNETRGQLESVTNSVDQRLNETRGQLESVTNSVDQRLNETRGQLESVTNSVDQRLNETRGQLESVTNSVDQRLNETRGQLESVTNSVDQRLNETRGQLESVTNSVDQRLNETRGQLESVTNSAGYLLGRVEFVRRELMFEMRYGASSPSNNNDQIKAKTKILNPEKLAAARNERLRLNLGCGHIALEGYLNVDRRALPGVDIVAEVDELPFEPGEVDEIVSAHFLEHFPQEQLRREILPYFFGLLKKGGVFSAVVPDAEAMIQEYAKGQYSYDDMREVMYGAQDYDGDFHFNMFTPDHLKGLLLEAGFGSVVINAEARRNGKCVELEITASKD